MVVGITSVSVLKNMYNILTELKKNIEIFFFKQVKRAAECWNGVLKNVNSLLVWRKKELVAGIIKVQSLTPFT